MHLLDRFGFNLQLLGARPVSRQRYSFDHVCMYGWHWLSEPGVGFCSTTYFGRWMLGRLYEWTFSWRRQGIIDCIRAFDRRGVERHRLLGSI